MQTDKTRQNAKHDNSAYAENLVELVVLLLELDFHVEGRAFRSAKRVRGTAWMYTKTVSKDTC